MSSTTLKKPSLQRYSEEEKKEMKRQFLEDGFFIQRILSDEEIMSLREDYTKVLSLASPQNAGQKVNNSLQHLGDQLSSFGAQPRQYYFHVLTTPGTEPLHHVYRHPRILEIVEFLLGENLIINNASILAANPGTYYNLGWHRDVIQIPEEEIRDELFSPMRHHNSCQLNLPLYNEGCLEVVPKSHHRPDNEEERIAFAGTKHYAPTDAMMPGGMKVHIEAGHAAFYNNNLIHRGYCEAMEVPRRTIHMGFHSATRKPTWHFYLLNPEKVGDEIVENLEPGLKEMMYRYRECYREYPNMAATWQPGWDGNP